MIKKILCLLLLTLLLPISMEAAAYQPKEVRGVWISTVYHLDYPSSPTTDPAQLQRQADEILDQCVAMGMTDVFFQVRPSGDALYASNIFPWSKYLTGQSGSAPADGFDPLSYWISGAHSRNLRLHAWINPFRAALSESDFESLSADSPAKQNPQWVVHHSDNRVYFNPGLPQVRQMVVDGVTEILERYQVDGIHFDDYFYPDASFDDEAAYEEFGQDGQSKEDWRRNNIDLLISQLGETVRGAGVSFGVSPAGIWANQSTHPDGSQTSGKETYTSMYADTRKWVKEGWLDYICPQIYWEIGHSAADYATLVQWWADTVQDTGVKLYVGMADYKVAENTWDGVREIQRQLELNQTFSQIMGEVHFRYGSLAGTPQLRQLYASRYHMTPQQVKFPDSFEGAYIQGIDGYFYPEKTLTRAEMAVILSRLLVDSQGNPLYQENAAYNAYFTDVSPTIWYAGPIGCLQKYGILSGYEDGTFGPEREISRAEFAVLLGRLTETAGEAQVSFFDVADEFWAAKEIQSAAANGYMNGYEDGTFRPQRSLTRSEAVAIFNRVLKKSTDPQQLVGKTQFPDVPKTHWAYYDILAAIQ